VTLSPHRNADATDRDATGTAQSEEEEYALKMSSGIGFAAALRRSEIESMILIAIAERPRRLRRLICAYPERQRSGYIPGSFHAPRADDRILVDPIARIFKEVFGGG